MVNLLICAQTYLQKKFANLVWVSQNTLLPKNFFNESTDPISEFQYLRLDHIRILSACNRIVSLLLFYRKHAGWIAKFKTRCAAKNCMDRIFLLSYSFRRLAMLTGWTQFSSRIRNKYIKVHRTLGKTYVTCAIMSGLAALYLSVYSTAGLITHLGFGILAILWIYCTTHTYFSIVIKGDTDMHQRWMIRSYALCFAAVTLRIWLPYLPVFFISISPYLIKSFRGFVGYPILLLQK